LGARNVSKGTVARLWNIAERRCAQCWQEVELIEIDGKATLVCPNGCEPGGHVSDYYVNQQRGRDMVLAWEAAKNYPELAEADGIMVLTEEGKKSLAELARAGKEGERLVYGRIHFMQDENDADSEEVWEREYHRPLRISRRLLQENPLFGRKKAEEQKTEQEAECQSED